MRPETGNPPPVVLRIRELGLEKEQFAALREKFHEPNGLILIAGPRESGVTTTQYALLKEHDAFMQNLLTLESKPLAELENVTQHPYVSGPGKSYAAQLQTVLRREPDVVLVGECPDAESLKLVLKAARSRVRIYLAVNAKDAVAGVDELRKLGADNGALADVLLAVVSPRVLRKLCPACRQAYKPDPVLLKKARLPVEKIEYFYRAAKGKSGEPPCPKCGGQGFLGSTGTFEVLALNDSLAQLIRAGATAHKLREMARRLGMWTFTESVLAKVLDGATAMTEALRVLRE